MMRGRTALGYYKDPAASSRTFRQIDGELWSVPGDVATVDIDGSVRLLGRGSSVINTGGEKVFAEEVEEVLKSHPSVFDAAVIGLPDERFGQFVAAAVQQQKARLADFAPDQEFEFGAFDLDEAALRRLGQGPHEPGRPIRRCRRSTSRRRSSRRRSALGDGQSTFGRLQGAEADRHHGVRRSRSDRQA